jgi:hypothetical protein
MTATGMLVDARPAALLPYHECPVAVPIESCGVRSYLFATVESVLDAKDDLLRAVGLSPGKLLSASGRGAT